MIPDVVRCDECGNPTRDPHAPHDTGCDGTEAAGWGCDCDHVTCEGCCWDCKAAGDLGPNNIYRAKARALLLATALTAATAGALTALAIWLRYR